MNFFMQLSLHGKTAPVLGSHMCKEKSAWECTPTQPSAKDLSTHKHSMNDKFLPPAIFFTTTNV